MRSVSIYEIVGICLRCPFWAEMAKNWQGNCNLSVNILLTGAKAQKIELARSLLFLKLTQYGVNACFGELFLELHFMRVLKFLHSANSGKNSPGSAVICRGCESLRMPHFGAKW